MQIRLDSLQEAPKLLYGKELVFNEEDHRYEWDGKVVPGVTTILKLLNKPALIQWSASMAVQYMEDNYTPEMPVSQFQAICKDARVYHRKFKEDAADIGKIVHKYAEDILIGKTPVKPADELALKGIAALEQWLSEHEIEPIALERRIFSHKHWYAGTTDFYGFIDGNRAILDWKTSSGIWQEYWYQTAGYEVALLEELGINEPMDRWIIRLDKKTGKFESKRKPYNPDHSNAWLLIRQLDRVLSKIEFDEKAEKPPRASRKKAA